MANKMLIDATHTEETRVVVLRGNRVEEFDFESANRKQLRGNIYLAKVTRVEPSLQAAFVDYGGNRHGFLAFGEIHPDYYQIPVADRQALIDEEERAARAADAEADHRAGRRAQRERGAHRRDEAVQSDPIESSDHAEAPTAAASEPTDSLGSHSVGSIDASSPGSDSPAAEPPAAAGHGHTHETTPYERTPHETTPQHEAISHDEVTALHEMPATGNFAQSPAANTPINLGDLATSAAAEPMPRSGSDVHGEEYHQREHGPHDHQHHDHHHDEDSESASGTLSEIDPVADGGNVIEVSNNGGNGEDEFVESVGGADAMEEMPERTTRPRRQYKIQEVIKRRQVMLVQVVKEERGTKGAALTTYLSLAGRYSVLMPNTARGGGISRKITDAQDRRRLKDLAQELEVPDGMGVILRTAGAARTKMEIKRDFEYLLRLWETVRDLTLNSTAPTLVYEEGSLIKRSIRDLYNKEIDEILVAGEDGYREAKTFMRMLMPSHAQTVKPFRDTLPIFTRFGIESQLDAMFQPVVQLRSGGYIVLNQTEALVAIDVNSGRATREHHIEDTALKTNMEAADEIARQLRLRDLAGLIVIDFIDMDEKRNNRTVERRTKDALKHDRARIQVGHISHFGLLEMSRQRIRSSVLESSTENCPHCGGTGHLRSVSSVALQLLRALEETLLKGATHNIIVRTRNEIALYLLNQKRAHLRMLEERFQIAITVTSDASMGAQVSYVIEKGELVHTVEEAKAIAASVPATVPPVADDDFDDDEAFEDEDSSAEEADGEESATLVADEHGAAATAGEAAGHRISSHDGAPQAGERGSRRRRRRRGRRGDEPRDQREPHERPQEQDRDQDSGLAADQPAAARHNEMNGQPEPAEQPGEVTAQFHAQVSEQEPNEGQERVHAQDQGPNADADAEARRRRRGRRGGRRNRRDREDEVPQTNGTAAGATDELHGADKEHHVDEVHHVDAQHRVADAQREFELAPPPVAQPSAHASVHSWEPAAAQPVEMALPTTQPEMTTHAHSPVPERPAQAETTVSAHPRSTRAIEPQVVGPQVVEPQPEPVPVPKEPSRRRSTVRERAPTAFPSDTAAPVPDAITPLPEPVVVVTSSSDSAETDRPRRAGWWSKRALGKG